VTAVPVALNVGLPIGCLAAIPGTDGDQLLAAGLTQFVGRYWTGEVVLLSVAAGSTALVTLGKSSLRAGVAGLSWLPVQAGTGKSSQARERFCHTADHRTALECG
jgi:hypothetical protein